MVVDLAEWVRTRGQRVQNPSRRTPDRSTDFNNADKVERQLQEDGHKIWGWIIYRCTYESDKDWEEFLNRLRFYIHETADFHNGLDMLESLDYHIFEDRNLFDGAHPSTICEYFKQWTVTAPQQEQGSEAKSSQRYRYCLHVDQTALLSVINGSAPPEDNLGDGFVNLVCLPGWWGGLRPEHTEDRDEREHCWMRVEYSSLMLGWYSLFRGQSSWFTEYRVPPEIGRT